MKNLTKIFLGFLIIVVVINGCIQKEPSKGPPIISDGEKADNITISIVYDNYVYDSRLKTSWGFSCLIETPDKNILFDTGADGPTLLSNMEELGIDPMRVDIVVLSHIHGDHVGGLHDFLEKNPNVTVYISASFPGKFRREIEEAGAQWVDVKSPRKITNYVSTTGELEGPPREQSLFISTQSGLVVITGCAHPGVVNEVKKAKELTNESIYLVLGGFHLSGADDSTIGDIIKNFRRLGVQKVAPCHCSGDRTRELFKKEYKDNYIKVGVGKIIRICTKN